MKYPWLQNIGPLTKWKTNPNGKLLTQIIRKCIINMSRDARVYGGTFPRHYSEI